MHMGTHTYTTYTYTDTIYLYVMYLYTDMYKHLLVCISIWAQV